MEGAKRGFGMSLEHSSPRSSAWLRPPAVRGWLF